MDNCSEVYEKLILGWPNVGAVAAITRQGIASATGALIGA
jgi:hypothetical protein